MCVWEGWGGGGGGECMLFQELLLEHAQILMKLCMNVRSPWPWNVTNRENFWLKKLTNKLKNNKKKKKKKKRAININTSLQLKRIFLISSAKNNDVIALIGRSLPVVLSVLSIVCFPLSHPFGGLIL